MYIYIMLYIYIHISMTECACVCVCVCVCVRAQESKTTWTNVPRERWHAGSHQVRGHIDSRAKVTTKYVFLYVYERMYVMCIIATARV